MEVIQRADTAPVLTDEERAKIPEAAQCVLTTLYGICNLLFEEKKTAFDAAEHLFYDHDMIFAGELVRGVLEFVTAASEYEAQLFHACDVNAQRRFDLKTNTDALNNFAADLHEARVKEASEEGRSHAKH